MTTNRKTLRIISYALLGICIAISVTYIVFSVVGILDAYKGISILFAILTPASFITFTFVYAYFASLMMTFKRLKVENNYIFGQPIEFYNSHLFTLEMRRLLRKKKYAHEQANLICFTPTKHAVVNNYSRNEIISKYLYLITRYISDTFSDETKTSKTSYAYCFYHGTFLLFTFGNDSEVEELIDKIENNLYSIASTNQFSLYIQPFFGVVRIERDKDETFIETSSEALIARDIGEKRYQSTVFYEAEKMKNASSSSSSIAEEIREGIKNEEFVVYYQPKFNLKSKQFISSEALVRWNSSKHGLLPPSAFIEEAENSGLIHMIDEYVLESVCRDIKDNRINGRRNLPVSVNFSVQEFFDSNFLAQVCDVCKKYAVPHQMIEIEITESTSQVNSFMSTSIIKNLKELGFRVLMDDFGTGFSNIENLMLLPFDAVKLDSSYIRRIEKDKKSRDLVELLIKLCRSNNLEIIAEGVDNDSQVRILREAECDTIQGYYYSRPIPKADFDKFIAEGNKFEKKIKVKETEE